MREKKTIMELVERMNKQKYEPYFRKITKMIKQEGR